MEDCSEVVKKRKANSPMESREKERRGERDSVGANEMEGLNVDSSNLGARRDSEMSKDSYSSVANTQMKKMEKPTRESVFRTSKPEGAFRDEIVVELQTLDEKKFRGTITVKEAINKIFVEKLEFQKKDLRSLIIGYSGGQIVTFKLFAPFNIDMLKSIEYFDLERPIIVQNEERMSVLKCKIRGIRKERDENSEGYVDSGMRWVKVEGCEFRVDKEQIVEWLSYFGEVKSEVTEDTVPDPDSEDDMEYGNGIYSVKMKIGRDLPQFMPMFGKRVRLYYRGIIKRCTNCFDPHQRKFCKNEKVLWAEYVRGFAETFPEIPRTLYGKWESMIDEETQGKTQSRENEGNEEIVVQIEKETMKTKKVVGVGREPSKTQNPQLVTKSMTETTQPTTQNVEREDVEQLAVEGVEGENEDETTDEEELLNLVKMLRASGVSKKSIKESLSQKQTKVKGKQGAGGRGRGRGSRGKN